MSMATPNIRMAIAASESETVLKVVMGSVRIGIVNGEVRLGGSRSGTTVIPPIVLKPPGVIWAFRTDDGEVGGFAADLVSLFANSLRQRKARRPCSLPAHRSTTGSEASMR